MEQKFMAEDTNHTFTIIYDKERLIKMINNDRCTLEDFDDGYTTIGGENLLSYDDYNRNLDAMIDAVNNNTQDEFLLKALESFPKKKDGTLKKRQILSVQRCNNSYYSEEEYGYPTEELRFKAIDDTTLELDIKRVVIGY